jgi:hypothetical protein
MKKHKPSLSLCIASREEPHLVDTIEMASGFNKAHGDDFECSVWFDGPLPWECNPPEWRVGHNETPEGSGISKHRAIMHATGDVIVLIDAHMILPKGWDKAVLEHFADPKHDKDVLCGKMICMEEWGNLNDEVKTGAEIILKSHSAGGWTVLQSAWKAQPVGEIGCCLGAFYAFRRGWYLQMGQPLGVMQGWGMEEEMLSLGSWIMGGRVVLADIKAAHLMKRPIKPPIEGQSGKIWRNRFRIVNVVPVGDPMRRELNDYLWQNPVSLSTAFVESVSRDAMRPEVIELKTLWQAHEAGWHAYAERFLNVQTRRGADHPHQAAAPLSQKYDIPQTDTRPDAGNSRYQCIGLPRCPRGHVDTAKVYKTIHETNGNTRRYGRCSVKGCHEKFVATDHGEQRQIRWSA